MSNLWFNCSICMINCMIIRQLIWRFFQDFRRISEFLDWIRNRLFRIRIWLIQNQIYSQIVFFTLKNHFCIELTKQTFANCNNALCRIKIIKYHHFRYHHRSVIIIIALLYETSHYEQFTIIRWDVDDFAFEYTHNYVQIAEIERFVQAIFNWLLMNSTLFIS